MPDRRTVTMTHIASLTVTGPAPGAEAAEILRMLNTSPDQRATASIVIPWIKQHSSLPEPRETAQQVYPAFGNTVIVPHEDRARKQYRLFWTLGGANLFVMGRAEVTPRMVDMLDASRSYWQRNGIDDPVVAFEAWTGTAQTHVAMIRAAFPEQTADLPDHDVLGLVFDRPTTD